MVLLAVQSTPTTEKGQICNQSDDSSKRKQKKNRAEYNGISKHIVVKWVLKIESKRKYYKTMMYAKKKFGNIRQP